MPLFTFPPSVGFSTNCPARQVGLLVGIYATTHRWELNERGNWCGQYMVNGLTSMATHNEIKPVSRGESSFYSLPLFFKKYSHIFKFVARNRGQIENVKKYFIFLLLLIYLAKSFLEKIMQKKFLCWLPNATVARPVF